MSSKAKTSQDAARGFTLVEVMFATSIFVVAALALAASMAQGSVMTVAPRNEMAARNVVREVVAEIAAAPFPEAAARFHGRAFDIPGLRAQATDEDGFPGEIEFADGPAGTPCYRITIRVRWHDRTGDRQIETAFMLANVRAETGTPPSLFELGTGGHQEPYRPGMSFEPAVTPEPDEEVIQ